MSFSRHRGFGSLQSSHVLSCLTRLILVFAGGEGGEMTILMNRV